MMKYILFAFMWITLVYCSTSQNQRGANTDIPESDAIRLELDISDVKNTMEGRGAGFCNSFITDEPEIAPQLKEARTRTLRYPMGTLAENYLFHNDNQNYADLSGENTRLRPKICSVNENFSGFQDIDKTTLEFNPELLDFDEFMNLCAEANAEPVIMLSAIGDLLDGSTVTKKQLMRNSIEWVSYARRKGYDITYWEFGNEITFHKEEDKIASEEYVSRYLYLQDTLKKINPDLKLGVGSLGWGNEVTIPEFLSYPKFIAKMDFFVVHQYNASGVANYEDWQRLTGDIVNNSPDDKEDFIPNIKKSIQLLDEQISQYPNLITMEYLITEHSTRKPKSKGWEGGGQHITQTLAGFQQIFNMFLYDQRIRYSHFWVTTSPWGDRSIFTGDAEAFNKLDNWAITPQGMTVALFNRFVLHHLIQPITSGRLGVYASTSEDQSKLVLFILNKGNESTHINLRLTGNSGFQINSQWTYGGTGDPYDQAPELKQVSDAKINGEWISTDLSPISLTIIELENNK
ncbi:MAG: hypothetical protein AAF519_19455 [Bacteroidota bacterium]